jgi:hypothetical protein
MKEIHKEELIVHLLKYVQAEQLHLQYDGEEY